MSKRSRIQNEKRTRNTSLIDLNDDCLRHMSSYLNNSDKLNLVLILNRPIDIPITKIDWNTFVMIYTTKEAKLILSRIGRNVERIGYVLDDTSECRSHFKKLNSHVQKYCSRVAIDLELVTVRMTNKIAALITTTLSQLTTLNLSLHTKITGKHIAKLKNLAHLELDNCHSLESKYFIAICKANKFRTLNISGCKKLNDDAFKAIADTQNELESIEFGDNSASNLEIVCQLKSLKRLKIEGHCCVNVVTEAARHLSDVLEELIVFMYDGNEIPKIRLEILKLHNLKKLNLTWSQCIPTDQFLKEIAENCKRLEEFHISEGCRVSDRSIIELVYNLPNLRILNLEDWGKFDIPFFLKIVEVVEKRKTNALKIHAFNTAIKEDFLMTEVYRKAKKLVVLSLDDPNDIDSDSEHFSVSDVDMECDTEDCDSESDGISD